MFFCSEKYLYLIEIQNFNFWTIYMVTSVEILEKLGRRLVLSIPLSEIQVEVEERLKVRARTTKANGFRIGRVPMKMVSEKYGHQIETEVLREKLSSTFNTITKENNLHIVGNPKIEPKIQKDIPGEMLVFDATFEVYPEINIGDLSVAEVETIKTEVGDAEIDKTIHTLRKQRASYHTKVSEGGSVSAEKGDRVTIDFSGEIDGQEFQGSKASNYVYTLGEGHMLPEFENSTLGLEVGEERRFDLTFPNNYYGKEIAGKTAKFGIVLKKLESAQLVEIDTEFAKSLGIKDGDLSKMRAEIKMNLEYEVNFQVLEKDKEAVMDALLKLSDLEVPDTLVEQEIRRLTEITRQDMIKRGMKDDEISLPTELFNTRADRRVRLGLILADVVKKNSLYPTEEQIKSKVEELSRGFESPQDVVKNYFKDRKRLADIEALVAEENVINYVLSKSKVVEKLVPFDELMSKVS